MKERIYRQLRGKPVLPFDGKQNKIIWILKNKNVSHIKIFFVISLFFRNVLKIYRSEEIRSVYHAFRLFVTNYCCCGVVVAVVSVVVVVETNKNMSKCNTMLPSFLVQKMGK